MLLVDSRRMDDQERDAAWAEVYAVLPTDWVVLRPMWQETKRVWAVYARSTTQSNDAKPWVEAFGETEVTALRALAQQFRTGGDVTPRVASLPGWGLAGGREGRQE